MQVVQTTSENSNNKPWINLENCIRNSSPKLSNMFCSGKLPAKTWNCELSQLRLKQLTKLHIQSKRVKNIIPTEKYKGGKPINIDEKLNNASTNHYNIYYTEDGDLAFDTITLVGGTFGLIGLGLSIMGIFYYKHYKKHFES